MLINRTRKTEVHKFSAKRVCLYCLYVSNNPTSSQFKQNALYIFMKISNWKEAVNIHETTNNNRLLLK